MKQKLKINKIKIEKEEEDKAELDISIRSLNQQIIDLELKTREDFNK